MANGQDLNYINIANDEAVPRADLTQAPNQKQFPIYAVAERLEKASLRDLEAHFEQALPFLTAPQIREITDAITAAVQRLEGRIAKVESDRTAPVVPVTPTPPVVTSAGTIHYGLVDTTTTPPTPVGTVGDTQYTALPSSVGIAFAILGADQGWYIQLPSSVTVTRITNTSITNEPEVATDTWTHDTDNHRWWTGGIPAGTSAHFTFALASTSPAPTNGNGDNGNGGSGNGGSGNGGSTPPPVNPNPAPSGVLLYGRVDAGGNTQGTASQEQLSTFPATLRNLSFGAGVNAGDGWFIQVPAGVEIQKIEHIGLDGEAQDLTSTWTYAAASRRYTRYGQAVGVQGTFTITIISSN